jgi:hypothetical protein
LKWEDYPLQISMNPLKIFMQLSMKQSKQMRPKPFLQMTNKAENIFPRIKFGIKQGLIKGWNGFVWLMKIIIPISFVTTLLVHFGIIYKLDFLLTPVMACLSLPPSSALVLIVGIFIGPYATVAALWAMPFAMEHMILMAVFVLICHNLIQESIIQGHSGINVFFAAFFRLFMAAFMTFACAKIMGVTPETGGTMGGAIAQDTKPFMLMLKLWSWGTFKLTVQVFCIIMPLMVMLELAKVFNIIIFITRLLSPVFAVMGLNRSTGMLWLTATIFGISYGAAVILEETQSNEYKKEDLTRLHLSIGVNHSMIEDPVLFLPLGLPVFWLWIPRLVAALMATWLYWLFLSARRLYAKRANNKKLCDN